jgi:hypothetical protein
MKRDTGIEHCCQGPAISQNQDLDPPATAGEFIHQCQSDSLRPSAIEVGQYCD